MSNFTEAMKINSEDALNVAEAYEGYARAMIQLDKPKDLPFVTSSLLISALYQSLFDPSKAKELFSMAADKFLQVESPLWRLCEICSQQETRNSFFKIKQETDEFDLEDYFYMLLQIYNLGPITGFMSYPRQFLKFEDIFNGRIPQLNIPYQVIIQTLNEFNNDGATFARDAELFLNILKRLGEMTSLYQSDEHRWRYVQGPLLPFEPAALAITLVLLKRWRLSYSYQELLEYISRIDDLQIPLLQIANQFLYGEEQFS